VGGGGGGAVAGGAVTAAATGTVALVVVGSGLVVDRTVVVVAFSGAGTLAVFAAVVLEHPVAVASTNARSATPKVARRRLARSVDLRCSVGVRAVILPSSAPNESNWTKRFGYPVARCALCLGYFDARPAQVDPDAPSVSADGSKVSRAAIHSSGWPRTTRS
jgi:hypothetical protein